MEIRQLAAQVGISPKTIRYYEDIGLLPAPRRKPNGYRQYSQADVERLQLVVGARRLGLALDEIREILDLRDRGRAPCRVLLQRLADKADEITRRIAELQHMERQLRQLYALGLTFPTDDVLGKACICHLVSEQAAKRVE
jgi:DNA-binding transcriptional MerR regulator